jgi:hypothetical protein
MNKYFSILLILILMGCVSSRPVCRHTAVMCGLVFAEQYKEVKIAVGKVPTLAPDAAIPYKYHAQAKAKVNGEWKWVSYDQGNCYISFRDNFVPEDDYEIGFFISNVLLRGNR